MSENFVRKTLNVKNIETKETYTLHDLDLVETEDGHVYIRIKNKNTEFNNEGDRFAYFYELTNAVRSLNKIELTNHAQLENISNLDLPLVMDVQHLVGKLQVTIAGNTATTFKVNGQSGTFNNNVTTYEVVLPGDTHDMPNLVIKEGNKVLATYETYLPDLEETQPQHPSYISGSDDYRTFRTSTRTRLNELEEYHFDLIKHSDNHDIIQLVCKTLPAQVSVYKNDTLAADQTNFIKNQRKLPAGYSLYEIDLGIIEPFITVSVMISGIIVYVKTSE